MTTDAGAQTQAQAQTQAPASGGRQGIDPRMWNAIFYGAGRMDVQLTNTIYRGYTSGGQGGQGGQGGEDNQDSQGSIGESIGRLRTPEELFQRLTPENGFQQWQQWQQQWLERWRQWMAQRTGETPGAPMTPNPGGLPPSTPTIQPVPGGSPYPVRRSSQPLETLLQDRTWRPQGPQQPQFPQWPQNMGGGG